MKKVVIFFVLFFCGHMRAGTQWTALYRQVISSLQAQQYEGRSSVSFAKDHVLPYTQLIFSWNIHRPSKGFFSLWVMARNEQTKQWYPWHKIADWGARQQKSYFTEFKGATGYHHVRLELPAGKKSDAFRVKIIAHEGALLSLIRGLYISVADFTQFSSEIADRLYMHLPSVHVAAIPSYSQMKINHMDADRMCSPTASSMLINYICKQPINPLPFALRVYDTGLDSYGNWTFNTAQAYEWCAGRSLFYIERLNSFEQLHALLVKKIPVVVSVRGPLPGSFREYCNGHLLLVTGWDRQHKQVICHDPAAPDASQVVIRYPIKNFLETWERSRRLAYVAQPMVVPA